LDLDVRLVNLDPSHDPHVDQVDRNAGGDAAGIDHGSQGLGDLVLGDHHTARPAAVVME
jgi:hypothetical protein